MKSFLLVTENVRQNCIREIQGLDLDKWKVTIREKTKSRLSEEYFHTILDYIEEHTGHSADELKVQIKIPILGYEEIEHNGEKYRIVKSSRNASQKDYNAMIDAALIIADRLEVVIPPKTYYGL